MTPIKDACWDCHHAEPAWLVMKLSWRELGAWGDGGGDQKVVKMQTYVKENVVKPGTALSVLHAG